MPTLTTDLRAVAPGTLIISANVRADTKIDKTFVSSIKQHGVRVPIIAEEIDGQLHVIDGQRRTLGAIEAGLDEVPVVVQQPVENDGARIMDQLVVNDHRAELTDVEHAAAYQELALFGMSADAISRKTNTPKKRVELALQVTASPAGAVMTEQQLTLDQAAVVMEFTDSDEDTAALVAAAKEGQLDHEAARIRNRRAKKAEKGEAIAKLEKAGVTIVDPPVDYSEPAGRKSLDYLYPKVGAYGRRLNPATHDKCPGHAAYVTERYGHVETVYVCTDWKANGHWDGSSSSTSKPEAGTPEAEAATAQRRLTLANNKLFVPASEVRIAWVKELLQRKELPGGWEIFVARHFGSMYNPDDGKTKARQYLEIGGATDLGNWVKANPARAPHLLIAMVIGWVENRPDFAKTGWRETHAASYLAQLSEWGYTLSGIEERVVNGTATKVDA